MLKWLSIVIMFIVFIVLLAVTLGNTHVVDFNLVGFQSTQWPLVAYLWIAFVVGAVVGVFSMLGRLLRLRNEAARLQKELKQARQLNLDLQTQLDQQVQFSPQAKPVEVIVPVQP